MSPGLDQLRQSKVQSFSDQRPLRCVVEGEDAGAIGLEKFIASLLGCAIQNLSPSRPRSHSEYRC